MIASPDLAGQPGELLLEPGVAEHRAEILKALGNPVRLRLVASLCAHGEATPGHLAKTLSVPQSSVSRQLGALRLTGLVEARADGGRRFYDIAMPQVVELMRCLSKCRRSASEAAPQGR